MKTTVLLITILLIIVVQGDRGRSGERMVEHKIDHKPHKIHRIIIKRSNDRSSSYNSDSTEQRQQLRAARHLRS